MSPNCKAKKINSKTCYTVFTMQAKILPKYFPRTFIASPVRHSVFLNSWLHKIQFKVCLFIHREIKSDDILDPAVIYHI